MTRRLTLVLSACASVLAALASAAACGDDGGVPATVTVQSGTANATGTTPTMAPTKGPSNTSEPALEAPASQYSLLLEDVGTNAFITDIPSTFQLDAARYGASKLFDSAADGEAKMIGWGYVDGYETALWPEGREGAMLNGAFIIAMEVHLFRDAAGAGGFYDYWLSRIQAAGVGKPIGADSVGNQSKAFKAVKGKIRGSNVDQAYHQMVFRRGNLVVVMQTIGAEPFMKADTLVALADLVDQKALGQLPTIAPTPTSNFTPNAGNPSPTASATAKP